MTSKCAERPDVKERPILFSGPMVRAILDGRKTQTRRVAKLPMFDALKMRVDEHGEVQAFVTAAECRRIGVEPLHAGPHWHHVVEDAGRRAVCPYGKTGDMLWVREAFYPSPNDTPTFCGFYRATDGERSVKWRPAIFMPRSASRITLEITDVRVERLQEISEQDAQSEGVDPVMHDTGGVEPSGHPCPDVPCFRESFADTWDSINGKRGFGWESNPWVWAITFKQVPESVAV